MKKQYFVFTLLSILVILAVAYEQKERSQDMPSENLQSVPLSEPTSVETKKESLPITQKSPATTIPVESSDFAIVSDPELFIEIANGGFSIYAPAQFAQKIKELSLPLLPYVFSPTIQRISISLVNEERRRGSMYSLPNNTIEAPYVMFSAPLYENEGERRVFHDLVHAIEKAMQEKSSENIQLLRNAYEYLVLHAGFNSMSDKLHFSNKTENNPYFKIFDESSYTPPFRPSPYGHPYASHSELFASALTIFRFFPDEFIRRFRELNPHAQETVRFVTKQLFEGLLLYNPDIKALQKLIPRYEEVLNGISSRSKVF
ncbi:MAG: hypothetical protein HYT27_02845 [Parcubacteria group bacterium]|nr:hypothetical protein [Parcubacteria group bacterium]